ncbi:MAG: hypothetical protein IPH91_00020 [Elusimicrobia bacterium]|nr:hypothetical protein [Elusimicrobiota bacterium]
MADAGVDGVSTVEREEEPLSPTPEALPPAEARSRDVFGFNTRPDRGSFGIDGGWRDGALRDRLSMTSGPPERRFGPGRRVVACVAFRPRRTFAVVGGAGERPIDRPPVEDGSANQEAKKVVLLLESLWAASTASVTTAGELARWSAEAERRLDFG